MAAARSDTAAIQGVKRIYDGARVYYMDTPQPGLVPVRAQFPSAPADPTPAPGACCQQGGKCVPEASQWQTEGWMALQFSVGDPHYYSYSYETPDEFAKFTVRANGDLDCDGLMSTFEMTAQISSRGPSEQVRRIIRLAQQRDFAVPGGLSGNFLTGSASIRRVLETE
ncbi:MAG: hypothetical protein MJE77_04040 [Proteobacteria bacterium]|nr:hypothetical protein [Pseudomonadota bacterium]